MSTEERRGGKDMGGEQKSDDRRGMVVLGRGGRSFEGRTGRRKGGEEGEFGGSREEGRLRRRSKKKEKSRKRRRVLGRREERKRRGSYRIAFWNVAGLGKKDEEFWRGLEDVVVMSETWRKRDGGN